MSLSLSLFCSSKTRFSLVVDSEAGFSGVTFRCSIVCSILLAELFTKVMTKHILCTGGAGSQLSISG